MAPLSAVFVKIPSTTEPLPKSQCTAFSFDAIKNPDAAKDSGASRDKEDWRTRSMVVFASGAALLYWLEFDTNVQPCLCIMLEKWEHALTICKHLLDSPNLEQFSCLSLAVAAGILQLLVDGMLCHMGKTYLQHFHNIVHPGELGTGAAPFHTTTRLPTAVRKDLVGGNLFPP